jgi:hypothetical protein
MKSGRTQVELIALYEESMRSSQPRRHHASAPSPHRLRDRRFRFRARPTRTSTGSACRAGWDELTEIVGCRRERTASMISLGSIPCKYVEVVPRSVCPS